MPLTPDQLHALNGLVAVLLSCLLVLAIAVVVDLILRVIFLIFSWL